MRNYRNAAYSILQNYLQLHNLYASPIIINVTYQGGWNRRGMQHELESWERNAQKTFVRKPEGTRPRV